MTAISDTTPEAAGYPPARSAWGLVILLTIAYVFSFVDRYILGLLLQPIKEDLQLTDFQIGLLLGPAFAIFYATMGLPLGWLADRSRRTWIVGAGVALWSLATAASGLAKSFFHLFIARMAVGVGEATLSPCAMSMIADSFPKDKRGAPIGLYSAALSLGAGFASLIGAAVLVWAKTAPEIVVPLAGAVEPWQLTFFIVGLPGLVVALPFFLLREPRRQLEAKEDREVAGSNLSDMLGYVAQRWGTYATFVSIACVMTIIAYSQGWLAATFDRTWNWPPERFALVNGIITLILGPATVNSVGWLSDYWSQRGRRTAPLTIMFAGALLMVPTGIIAPLMPDPISAFAVFALNTVGIATVTTTAITALLNITPGKVRAQMVALYYMVISITGLLLGPPTVGWLTDNVVGTENLRYAMAMLPAIYGTIPLLLIPVTRRLYVQQMDRLEGRVDR